MRNQNTTNDKKKVLMLASVASMIDQFNMPNIRLMLDMEYEVHVACNFKAGNTCSRERIRELQKTLQDMHVVQHQWDCPRNLRSVKKCVRAYRQLLRLAGENSFAWIHCHSPVGGALARLAAHRYRIPVIYTAHGFHFYKGAPLRNWMLYYPAEWFLARWTDVLITINKEDYRLARRRLRAGKVCRIPGVGVDTARFESAAPSGCGKCEGKIECGKEKQQAAEKERKEFCRTYRIPENALVLLSAGELNREKNHRMVIAALAAVPQQNVYYLICGKGMMRTKLQQYADRIGSGGRIRMPGYEKDMPFVYRNADIFVFPSMREGMPVALMEAMASGLPCIVSDIRGNRELIDSAGKAGGRQGLGSGGIRFSLKRPGQLQQALVRMISDECFRMECGRHNKEKIKSRSQEAVQQKMKKIYGYICCSACGRE